MVTLLRNRRGAGTLGCLFSLLIFAAILYYGYHVGQVYWKFYQLQDAMAGTAVGGQPVGEVVQTAGIAGDGPGAIADVAEITLVACPCGKRIVEGRHAVLTHKLRQGEHGFHESDAVELMKDSTGTKMGVFRYTRNANNCNNRSQRIELHCVRANVLCSVTIASARHLGAIR